VRPDGEQGLFHFMSAQSEQMQEVTQRCELYRDEMRERLASFDRRLLALEIVRGEDGRNGMKAKLTELCQRFDAFEQKAIRWISIGTSLPGIVVGVVAVLRFLGKA